MLNAINTKILLAILASLVGIGALLTAMRSSQQKALAAQQQLQQQAEAQRQHDEDFRKAVEAQKRKSHAYAGHESKTWQNYLP